MSISKRDSGHLLKDQLCDPSWHWMQTYFEYLAASFVPEQHLMSLRNLLQLWILGSCKIIFLYLVILRLPKCCCTPLECSTYFPLRCSCQQKACGCIPCTATEFSLQTSGLLVAVDQTGGSHEQDVKARGQYIQWEGDIQFSLL